MLLDAKLSKQFDDFSISLAIKAWVIFVGTGQSALRNMHGARRIGACQTLEAFQPLIGLQAARNPAHRFELYRILLDAIATHRVADQGNRTLTPRRANQLSSLAAIHCRQFRLASVHKSFPA